MGSILQMRSKILYIYYIMRDCNSTRAFHSLSSDRKFSLFVLHQLCFVTAQIPDGRKRSAKNSSWITQTKRWPLSGMERSPRFRLWKEDIQAMSSCRHVFRANVELSYVYLVVYDVTQKRERKQGLSQLPPSREGHIVMKSRGGWQHSKAFGLSTSTKEGGSKGNKSGWLCLPTLSTSCC